MAVFMQLAVVRMHERDSVLGRELVPSSHLQFLSAFMRLAVLHMIV